MKLKSKFKPLLVAEVDTFDWKVLSTGHLRSSRRADATFPQQLQIQEKDKHKLISFIVLAEL